MKREDKKVQRDVEIIREAMAIYADAKRIREVQSVIEKQMAGRRKDVRVF